MPASDRFENYEVLHREDGSIFELGRGAMGVTYKARDTDLHCDVALKVINPSILGDPDARERFLREARAAARLRHPNIASVFRLGKAADGTHFYAMEFCEGPTLDQAVAVRGPFPAAEAVRIAWQVCKALLVAEQHRVVHRDLKPSNLVLTESRDEGTVVKVIDFGLAKSFADGKQTLATMSTSGFVGTAHFASPEQLEEHELDIRSDIYSLGVCLWFMLDGRPPFTGSLARVMSQMLSSDPPWDRLAAQPAKVVELLRRMLAKNPDARPATAAELRKELEECIRALESPVPTSEFPQGSVVANRALEEWEFATRYPVSEEVGKDVLGRIFRGADESNGGETVAVRVIDAALVAVPATRRDLEAQIAAARVHPHRHLVALFDHAFSSHGLCIATEWLEGFSLLELLKQRGALAPGEVVRLLAPLAEAADHATRCGLRGLQLSKQQVHVHFPGGLSGEERETALAAPVQEWPPHVVKADVLSLGENGGAGSGTMHSMMTFVPGSVGNGVGARATVPELASLANELLGARGGPASAPIARLSEAGNAVLRRASTEEHAFPTAETFVQALGATIGKDASASPPRTHKPQSSSSPSSPSRLGALVGVALLLLAFVGAGFGYYYGIHLPRERAREKRKVEADAPAKDLAEKQRLATAEQERIRKEDAEKANVESERSKTELQKRKQQQEPAVSAELTRRRQVHALIEKHDEIERIGKGPQWTGEVNTRWKAITNEIRQFPAPANADSTIYDGLIAGVWSSPRHEYLYRSNGTWTMLPIGESTTRGSWRIEGNTFSSDSIRYTMVLLDETDFVYMDEHEVFYLKRLPNSTVEDSEKHKVAATGDTSALPRSIQAAENNHLKELECKVSRAFVEERFGKPKFLSEAVQKRIATMGLRLTYCRYETEKSEVQILYSPTDSVVAFAIRGIKANYQRFTSDQSSMNWILGQSTFEQIDAMTGPLPRPKWINDHGKYVSYVEKYYFGKSGQYCDYYFSYTAPGGDDAFDRRGLSTVDVPRGIINRSTVVPYAVLVSESPKPNMNVIESTQWEAFLVDLIGNLADRFEESQPSSEKSPSVEKGMQGERFPETRIRLLKIEDIQSWNDDTLRYAINEMYARRGADFRDKALKKLFSKFPWYHPSTGKTYDAAEQDFTLVEENNNKLLGAFRDQRAGHSTQTAPPTAAVSVILETRFAGTWTGSTTATTSTGDTGTGHYHIRVSEDEKTVWTDWGPRSDGAMQSSCRRVGNTLSWSFRQRPGSGGKGEWTCTATLRLNGNGSARFFGDTEYFAGPLKSGWAKHTGTLTRE